MIYNYCPHCGKKIDKSPGTPHCKYCDSSYYSNAKPCASVLPIREGKVLLARRAKEPHKGAYDTIGGFMEADETPEQAALREAKEETGLDMKIVSLLGIYNDQYGDKGDRTLNLHYIAEIVGGEMQAMDDVEALEWIDIERVQLDSGFQNTRDSMRDLKTWFKKQH